MRSLTELFNKINTKKEEFKLNIESGKKSKTWKNGEQKSKIGGNPDWIQSPQTLVCDKCKKKMSFYGQLDSINDDYKIADAGMIYVFVCKECVSSKSIIQSY